MAKRKRKKRKVYVIHNKRRNRWRVVTISPTGKRAYAEAESQGDAETLKDTLLEAGEFYPTFDEAIDKFKAHKKETVSRRTLETALQRLRAMFDKVIDKEVIDIDERGAQKIYDEYRETPTRTGKPPSVATRQNTLDEVNRFFQWMVKAKLASFNPFSDVEKKGKKNKGKKQLTDEEAAIFNVAVRPIAESGDLGALACVVALTFGLRAGEIAGIKPEDITAFSIYIRRSSQDTETTKTEAGIRRLRIPPELTNLTNAAKRHCEREFVFGDRHWVLRNVKKFCKYAGVPVVTAQGLRGTAASLAMESGQIGAAVIHSLGHASLSTTKAHYLKPGSLETANAKSVSAFLEGAKVVSQNCIPNERDPNAATLEPVVKGVQTFDIEEQT